jgi:hypothetical protein
MRITLPAIMSICLLAPLASGTDKRIQVEATATRSVVAALLAKPTKAEIQLKDGSKLSGSLIAAAESGLLYEVKKGSPKGVQTISYNQLSLVRVDLGPNHAWGWAGSAIGAAGGLGVAFILDSLGSEAALGATAYMVVGGMVGAKLGERHHRHWLIVEVR